MAALLDEDTDTVILDELDLAPDCEVATCDNRATLFVSCRGCRNGFFLCGPCWEVAQMQWDVRAAMGMGIECKRCGRTSRVWRDVVKAVQL